MNAVNLSLPAPIAKQNSDGQIADLGPFARFWELGFRRLLPIIPPSAEISERSTLFKRVGTSQDGRGKTPGTRGRDGKWASFDWAHHQADASDISRWEKMDAGVGVQTGLQPDGTWLLAIDADTMVFDYARRIRDRIQADFGRLYVRVGQSPKAIYLIRVNGPFPYRRIEFGEDTSPPGAPARLERIEVLSDGKQFVAEGVHPKTGKPYHWPRNIPQYQDIPVVAPEKVVALLEKLRLAGC